MVSVINSDKSAIKKAAVFLVRGGEGVGLKS